MDQVRLITFCVGTQLLAIPLDQVREVIRNVPVASAAAWTGLLHGIINVRGKVIPVLDLRKLLAVSEPQNTRRTRIIIVEMLGRLAGLVVDQVNDIVPLKQEQVVSKSAISLGRESALLIGVANVEETMYLVIDVHQLIHEEERNLFRDLCFHLNQNAGEAATREAGAVPESRDGKNAEPG